MEMPARRNRTGQAGAWPLGLIGMAALVGLVELGLGRYDLARCDEMALNYRFTRWASATEATDAEVLCVGDSLLKLGVYSPVIEGRLGRRAYNLANSGGMATVTYYSLRRALDAGARPKALIVDFKPTQAEGHPACVFPNATGLLGVSECFDLARTARDPDLFAGVMLAEALPSWRDRLPLRTRVVASFAGKVPPDNRQDLALWRNWRVNRGAHVIPPRPGAEAEPVQWDEPFYTRTGPWFCNPTNAKYILRTLDLAESRGIAVYWLIPPILPRVQARREQLGTDAAFSDFVARVQARHPKLRVIDGRHSGYGPALFLDGAHLNSRGASAFSLALAEVLARPADSRWIDLPAFREAPPGVPIENIYESAIALKDAGLLAR